MQVAASHLEDRLHTYSVLNSSCSTEMTDVVKLVRERLDSVARFWSYTTRSLLILYEYRSIVRLDSINFPRLVARSLSIIQPLQIGKGCPHKSRNQALSQVGDSDILSYQNAQLILRQRRVLIDVHVAVGRSDVSTI